MSPDRGPVRRVVAVAAVAFLLAPGLAYLLGERAGALENRALAPRPSLSDGWDVFDRTSQYTIEHLPLRPMAARAQERIAREVFREPPSVATVAAQDGTPYPQVIVGRQGWLYYGRDMQNPCDPVRSVDKTISQLERFSSVVRASGRQMRIVIVPDKSQVVPEHLPSRYIGRRCAQLRRSEFWTALTAAQLPDLVDLRGPLRSAQQRPGGAYLRTDSHWTPLGQSVYAEALVGAVQPKVWDAAAIQPHAAQRRLGDLAPFVRSRDAERVPGLVAHRPSVTLDGQPAPSGSQFSRRLRATATAPGQLVTARTSLVGDSFTFTSVALWRPWFADITTFHRERSSAAEVVAGIQASEVVVLEVVERDAVRGVLLPRFESFLNQLEDRLE